MCKDQQLELENCLYRARALALVLSDTGCRESLSEFEDSRHIFDGLHWLLCAEIDRAYESFMPESENAKSRPVAKAA